MTDETIKRLNICAKIRQAASDSCLMAIQKTVESKKPVPEIQFRDWWLEKLDKSDEVVSGGGLYNPPPFRIGVLFGSETNFARVNYPTLRPKEFWPKQDSYFLKNGLGYLFASPYSLVSGVPIIGDFGFTFYLGKNKEIIDHFKKCKDIVLKLLDRVKPGITLSELYSSSIDLFDKNNLVNNVTSTTDKLGADIGHTIPFINDTPEDEAKDHLYKFISKSRVFINAKENYLLTDNIAFTFEPRLTSQTDESIPMFSMHLIVMIVDGKKRILGNFDKIFDLLGMEWLK